MLPSEDQKTEHDIGFLYYQEEYQKIQERFQKKKRSENLLKQLSLNRDCYQVIRPPDPFGVKAQVLLHTTGILTFFAAFLLKNVRKITEYFSLATLTDGPHSFPVGQNKKEQEQIHTGA